jgi:hypothetical protein
MWPLVAVVVPGLVTALPSLDTVVAMGVTVGAVRLLAIGEATTTTIPGTILDHLLTLAILARTARFVIRWGILPLTAGIGTMKISYQTTVCQVWHQRPPMIRIGT